MPVSFSNRLRYFTHVSIGKGYVGVDPVVVADCQGLDDLLLREIGREQLFGVFQRFGVGVAGELVGADDQPADIMLP